jgi:hypothetical protein
VNVPQDFVAQPQLLHRPGPEVLDHDVELPDQPLEELGSLRGFQVERHALLVPVDAHEIAALAVEERPERTGVVPGARSLDLHDLGSQVGQGHAREGACEDPCQVEHPDTFEKWRHLDPPLS